jgi:hypothetical protein
VIQIKNKNLVAISLSPFGMAMTVPLVISVFAAEVRGGTLGFLNSVRFVAGFVGPILATSILAFSNLTALYVVISGMTLLVLVAFRQSLKDRRGTEELALYAGII